MFINIASILDSIHETIIDCFAQILGLYNECTICLISFLSFCELFPAFNWPNKIGNLVIICCGVNIFNPCSCCLSAADFSF